MLTHGLLSRTARRTAPRDPAILIARAHILGLALIAVIALGTHYVMDRLLVAERGKAAVLDLAGEQHMLTERIKALALQLTLADHHDDLGRLEDSLATAIHNKRAGHDLLIRGDDTRLLPGITEFAADEIYFGPQIELDRQVRTFLAAAQSFLDLPAARRQHERVFLEYMLGERGAALHADEARAADSLVTSANRDAAQLRRVLWVMFAALMFSIFFEWLLIYRPSLRRIGPWRRS